MGTVAGQDVESRWRSVGSPVVRSAGNTLATSGSYSLATRYFKAFLAVDSTDYTNRQLGACEFISSGVAFACWSVMAFEILRSSAHAPVYAAVLPLASHP